MMKPVSDFLIVGAGIFGITTAIELRKRGYQVVVLNPDQTPHPLAASTDISKIVRMEYGSDTFYMDMAEVCIDGWKRWNELFGEKIYHEVGFLLLCRESMNSNHQIYELSSFKNLMKKGYQPDRLDRKIIAEQFPVFSHRDQFVDGFFHKKAGFAEAAKTIEILVEYARQLGVIIEENQTVEILLKNKNKIEGVCTREGNKFSTGHVVICAGANTPYLLPELQPYFRVTGHPVFHLRPNRSDLFSMENVPVFATDISNTGWYGFPIHPQEGVIKIAKHGTGLRLHPEKDERIVTEEDTQQFQKYIHDTFPFLKNDPMVFTRRCVYTDTLDGHFWIDQHPEIEGVTIGTGGSGHGFKMGPLLGEIIAITAEGGDTKWSSRFRWRDLSEGTKAEEEARADI